MFAPGPKVTRVNLKPLLPGFIVSSDRILRRLQSAMLKQIKKNIMQETFSPAAKKRLTRGFEVQMGPSSITVIAKDPAFRPLLQGQKKQQMTWLTKAKVPIPIVLDSGELIFRWATPKSMENGRWVHPGRQPTTVIERAKEAAKKAAKREIKAILREQLKAATGSK